MTNFNFLLNNLSYLSSEDLVGRPMDSTCFRSAPVPLPFRLRLHPLRMVATLLLLLCIGVGNVWGADVTYTFSSATNNPGNGTEWYSDDIDAYTNWSATEGDYTPKYYSTGSGLRVYNGGNFSISSTKTISSITLTFSGTSYTFSTSNTTTPQTVSPNSTSYEWSVSRTCRLQKIEITYAVATPYTVRFYKTDGTYEDRTEASAGAGVTPPSMDTPCDGWAFQGWSKSHSTSTSSTTVLTTETLTAGKYYPSSDVTLYPVYTKSGGSVFARYSKVTSNPSDWSGTYLLAANTSGSTYYTFTGQNSSNDYGNSSSHTPGTTEKTSWEVVVAKTTNGYSIYHTNAKKYLGLTVDDNKLNFNSTFSATEYEWTLSYNNGAQSVNKTNRYIECNTRASYRVACYAGTQKRFFLYKRIEDPIIYYYSYPSCCTPLGSINGSINLIQRKQSEMDFHLVIISVFQRSHHLPFGHLPFGNFFSVLAVTLYFV